MNADRGINAVYGFCQSNGFDRAFLVCSYNHTCCYPGIMRAFNNRINIFIIDSVVKMAMAVK